MTRHLVHQYQDSYTVICLDKMDNVSSLNSVLELFRFPNFRFIHGSITDRKTVCFALETYEVDCVVHFAANSHVQNSFKDPYTFTENNVVGTHVCDGLVTLAGYHVRCGCLLCCFVYKYGVTSFLPSSCQLFSSIAT